MNVFEQGTNLKFPLLKKYIIIILTLMFFVSSKNTFGQEPFVLDTAMIETIPTKHLSFLEGLDHEIPFEALDNAEWTEKLINVLGEDHRLQSKQVSVALTELNIKCPEVVFYAFIKLLYASFATILSSTDNGFCLKVSQPL